MTVLTLVPTILTAIYVGATGIVVALGMANWVLRWADRHGVAAQGSGRHGLHSMRARRG